MALANGAQKDKFNAEVTPLICYYVEFDGDDAYAAGGTADFTAFVKELLGRNVEIIASLPNLNGNYIATFDKENDKLFVLDRSTGIESVVSDMSGTTFRVPLLCC